jgi:hypothetical protein
MENKLAFGEILEAADRLSVEEQEALVDVLHRRIIELRREDLLEDIRQARHEFEGGQCQPRTPEELIREIVP